MSDDAPQTGPERIAKVMARAGVASRRDAERMIVEGRVTVNGVKVTSPALDVAPGDRVMIDGKPMDAPQKTRLWLYYKPLGLVTSEKDEKGRQTVFDTLPRDMPRVMSVGRLDLNSEGLLLLTNDGGLKRRLELPETGWLRKYRVRVNGRPNDATFDPLRRGVVIEGEEFQPMEVELDRQQGANAWLTVGIREGRNREVRRAMAEVGLVVNRLIRVSYGPFRLNEMEPGAVVEVKAKVLKDQLGMRLLTGDETAEEPRAYGAKAGFAARKADDRPSAPRKPRDSGERPFGARDGGGPVRSGAPRKPREDGDRPYSPRARADGDAPRKSYGDKPYAPRKPREDGDRPYTPRARADGDAPRKSYGDKPYAPRKPREDGDRLYTPRARADGDAPRKSYGDKPYAPRKPREDGDRPYTPRARADGDAPRKSYGDKPYAPRKPREDGDPPYTPRARADGDAPRKSYGDKPYAPRKPREDGDRPYTPRARSDGDAPRKSYGDKPYAPRKPREDGDRPYTPRARADGDGPRKSYGGRPGEGRDGAPKAERGAFVGGKPFAGKPGGGRPSGTKPGGPGRPGEPAGRGPGGKPSGPRKPRG